uniref:Uncharacterized protein n=1 Tax=Candidatus Kentrum sp. MB TaxID=2138164 RepID=A0A450X8Z9_9GAMM|nr:MAG: hypothetical protein BECKMB1821G_GA0114241_101615 [Candidatus Kentron sp. MB]VFK27172.1 MAG: hypothetical protein BECKMB1821I_GA0114274_100266 [Candidatus Kentron sp. MB]VFK75078.1 MAG: hypothetical protein BECKMB1821H_GA0114242_101515 [Candidatus Kentron sp. MB]
MVKYNTNLFNRIFAFIFISALPIIFTTPISADGNLGYLGYLEEERQEIGRIVERYRSMSDDKLVRSPYIRTKDGKLHVDLMLRTTYEIDILGPKPFIEEPDRREHIVYRVIERKEYRVPAASMDKVKERLYTIRFVEEFVKTPKHVAREYRAKQVTRGNTVHVFEEWDAIGYGKDRK